MALAGCIDQSTEENSPPVASAAVVDCNGTTDACAIPDAGAPEKAEASGPEKIEVYHFHGNSQCYSCVTLGEYAEETVKTHFADELETGKIVFAHVNGELPENAELVRKYGATGSSLWIGVYDESGFHAEQNTNVWYKLNNKNAFMGYLKGVIQEKLGG